MDVDSSPQDFKLRSELRGHEEDVRSGSMCRSVLPIA